jgi:hypothetical protein
MADRQPSMKAGTARILSELRRVFSTTPASPNTALFSALRLLAKWRAEELKAPAIAATGGMVAGGPFAGMRFEDGATEGCFLPKLLGCYEAELHAYWTGLRRDRHYRTIVDIGAAEGYYVVGLARMFPEARLIARDTNPEIQPFLDRLATANGVRDRIEIGGEFGHADFAAYADQPTLLVCDIEAASASCSIRRRRRRSAASTSWSRSMRARARISATSWRAVSLPRTTSPRCRSCRAR